MRSLEQESIRMDQVLRVRPEYFRSDTKRTCFSVEHAYCACHSIPGPSPWS